MCSRKAGCFQGRGGPDAALALLLGPWTLAGRRVLSGRETSVRGTGLPSLVGQQRCDEPGMAPGWKGNVSLELLQR